MASYVIVGASRGLGVRIRILILDALCKECLTNDIAGMGQTISTSAPTPMALVMSFI